jgi:hypothetical protein
MAQTVPIGAGVPAVLNIYDTVAGDAELLIADAQTLVRYLAGPQWGIFSSTAAAASASSLLSTIESDVTSALSTAITFLGGNVPTKNPNTPLLVGNYSGTAIKDMSFMSESTVSTYPVEAGGFASYDKVVTPYSAKVTISVGGKFADRKAALTTLDGLKTSLTLVDVVTPEEIYPSATVVHYDYDRSSVAGAGMLNISIWLEEIRVITTAATTNTAEPSGTDSTNGGTVQTDPVIPVQQSALTSTGVQ